MSLSAKLSNIRRLSKCTPSWLSLLLLKLGLKRTSRVILYGPGGCKREYRVDRESYALVRTVLHHLCGILESLGDLAVFDPCGDTLTISLGERRLVFKNILGYPLKYNDSSYLYSIYEIFVKNEYSFLNVKNKTVIDVGAAAGESTLYLAARGASRITAYEPIPELCSLARENARASGLTNIVEVRCKAVAEEEGEVLFCREKSGSALSRIVSNPSECRGELIRVPTEPLPGGDVLKMDCEGCEYTLINKIVENGYGEVGLEYHGDPSPLVGVLEENGYRVRVLSREKDAVYEYVGLLHATKNR